MLPYQKEGKAEEDRKGKSSEVGRYSVIFVLASGPAHPICWMNQVKGHSQVPIPPPHPSTRLPHWRRMRMRWGQFTRVGGRAGSLPRRRVPLPPG